MASGTSSCAGVAPRPTITCTSAVCRTNSENDQPVMDAPDSCATRFRCMNVNAKLTAVSTTTAPSSSRLSGAAHPPRPALRLSRPRTAQSVRSVMPIICQTHAAL